MGEKEAAEDTMADGGRGAWVVVGAGDEKATEVLEVGGGPKSRMDKEG